MSLRAKPSSSSRLRAKGVAATVTPQHLLLNRNAIFQGGIRPHNYCLPVLKRERDREAFVAAATSDDPRFFLGTDSAPHASTRRKRRAAVRAYSRRMRRSSFMQKPSNTPGDSHDSKPSHRERGPDSTACLAIRTNHLARTAGLHPRPIAFANDESCRSVPARCSSGGCDR